MDKIGVIKIEQSSLSGVEKRLVAKLNELVVGYNKIVKRLGDAMNLKNKTEEELWDMLDKIERADVFEQLKYDIHEEIIRKEKENG